MYAVFFSLCKCARHSHLLYFCELMFLSDSHVVGQTIQPWRYEQRDYMLLLSSNLSLSLIDTCFCVTVI